MPSPVSSPVTHALVVAPGEIVGIVAARLGAATPLLLDVAARAIVDGTRLMLLDLPFEHMDHQARVVASELARHAALGGAAVVVVAHRQPSLAHLAHRVVVLRDDARGATMDDVLPHDVGRMH